MPRRFGHQASGAGGRVARDRRDLAVQLERWRADRLERLVRRLADLHRALLANSQAAELLLAQELAAIARYASARA